MKRVIAAVLLAAACVAGSTSGYAQRGARGAPRAPDPTTLLGSPAPQTPTFQNRSPAPLASPSQAPVVNGPPARSPYGGVMR